MYWINKIVWFFLNPVTVPLAAGLAGIVLYRFRGGRLRRLGAGMVVAAFALLWLFATPLWAILIGTPLERPYLATQRPESLPAADAIVLLGGGIGKCAELEYPDMADGADRVWHAARLYRAGKAPRVVVSGANDLAASVPLLVDLGVPREAILVDDRSRNTYENSRFTEGLLKAEGLAEPSVLLVTSAWHMPRALGNFAKTSLAVTPAAADFKVHNLRYGCRHWLEWLLPFPSSLDVVNAVEKEWLGRLARK